MIRPYVLVKQGLDTTDANIRESLMKGMLVGPCVQEEYSFRDDLNCSTRYGSISDIMTEIASSTKTINIQGIIAGSSLDDFRFGAKSIVSKIELDSSFSAKILGTDKFILEIGVDELVTREMLISSGISNGDTLEVIVDNNGTNETETHKIREIVEEDGKILFYLWNDIQNPLVADDTVDLGLKAFKNIESADIEILAPMVAEKVNSTSVSLNNVLSPIDGGFIVKYFVYKPIDIPVNFSNREISIVEMNTLHNYEKVSVVNRVIDGQLYNFFTANRLDLSNNIFEVTKDNYENILGYPTEKNKVSYAMKLILDEVPGAIMKIFVTQGDGSDDYISAFGSIATADNVYSVTPLTDDASVVQSIVGMIDMARGETVAKWKMAIVGPRVPHATRKITSDAYEIYQKTRSDYEVTLDAGGLLTLGVESGDYIFSGSGFDDAESSYYSQYSETYTGNIVGEILKVVTDDRMVVSSRVPGADLVEIMTGEDIVIASIDTHGNLLDKIKSKTESINNSGVVSIFPDKGTVGASDTIIPGYMMAAILNGVMAHLPPQQGLSNLSFSSIGKIIGSSFTFTDGELDELASSGSLVILQETYSSDPYILRQLTTNIGSLEEMEINKVRCLDYATLAFSSGLDAYVGKRNVTEDNIDDIKAEMDTTGKNIISSTKLDYLGSVITTYEIIDVYVPESEPDGVNCVVDVETPTSLNKIRLFVNSK